jgi:signal transduction histidine kinase
LINAMEANADGGTIKICLKAEGNQLLFKVADSGPGVPDDKLTEILTPFFTTKGSRGTGLGLAMVSKFCEENSGKMEVQGYGELGGLSVTLRLPLLPAQPEQ